MNPYSIPPAICSIFALALGIFALRYNYKSSAARIFFGQCCTIIVWQSFYWIIYNFGDHNSLIYSYAKFSYCGISFIPSVFYQCICELLEITKYKKWYLYNYLFSIISSFFILKSNYIINGLCRYPWGLYIKAGPAHPVYLFFFIGICLLGLSIIILSFKENKDSPKKLNRSKYVAAAFCIFSLSNFDFLPAYGINLYPIGYLYTAIFLCIIAYATIKYQLLDINIAIKKSIIYSLLVTFLTFIYIVLIIVFERLSQSLFGYKDILGSFFAAVVIAAAFIPFRNKLQKLIDAIFLKGSPIKISEENELLRKEVTQTDKLKAIATLASGIAHEIRNPITAIKTFSEYLPQKANDQEFLRNYSRTVNKEIDRIDNLIKDLLDFAKPSSPLLQETEIHDLLGNTLNLIQGKLQKNDIALQKDFHRSEIRLQIDPNQIKQALLNVLLNAIDAMPSGGKLTVKTSATENEAEIAITDTGCGIAPNDLPHIFEPFYSKKEKGTGLGLAISLGIIHEHKGTMIVKSSLERGTTCTVTLPVKTIHN